MGWRPFHKFMNKQTLLMFALSLIFVFDNNYITNSEIIHLFLVTLGS